MGTRTMSIQIRIRGESGAQVNKTGESQERAGGSVRKNTGGEGGASQEQERFQSRMNMWRVSNSRSFAHRLPVQASLSSQP